MDLEDVFELCMESLLSDSACEFVEMRENGEYCDVTIRVGGSNLNGHRLVLVAAIPYFKTIFRYNMNKTKDEVVLEGLDPLAVDSLISFAYVGNFTISSSCSRSLLEASMYLQMDYVTAAVIQFLTRQMKPNNVFTIRAWAEELCNDELLENAERYIRENFDEASSTKHFLELPFRVIKDIICKDDLNVLREANVFESVLRWVRGCAFGRSYHLPELLHNIRMHLMAPEDIINRISEEELVRKSRSCRYIIDQAKSYHLLSRRGGGESFEVLGKGRFTPSGFTVLGRYSEKRHRNCVYSAGYGLYSVCLSATSMLRINYFDQIDKKWIPLCDLISIYPQYVACQDRRIYIIHHSFVTVLSLDKMEESYFTFMKIPPCAGITLHNQKIYFLGGGYENIGNEVQYLDTEKLKCVCEGYMIRNRKCPGVASLGDDIYVTGGVSGYNTAVLKVAEKYNTSTGLSTKISPMLKGRWQHSCCAMQGKIYACGGHRRCGVLDTPFTTTCQVYDPQTDKWSFVRCMNTMKKALSLFSCENKLYAFDVNLQNVGYFEAETYNPEEDEWTAVDTGVLATGNLKTAVLFDHSAVAVIPHLCS